MDKKSMAKITKSCKVRIGLDEFLEMAFANRSVNAKVICPCKGCGEESSVPIKIGKDHPTNSIGSSSAGFAKLVSSKITSQTSDENQVKKVVEENIDIESFKNFVEQSVNSGIEGQELYDSISNFLNLNGGGGGGGEKNEPDKSFSMLFEFSKEVSEKGADSPRSVSETLPCLVKEQRKKKAPRKKQTRVSALISSSGCEEEGRVASRDKENQPSASTSSGLTGCSPKEENRRKLREKINQRRVSRSPSVI